MSTKLKIVKLEVEDELVVSSRQLYGQPTVETLRGIINALRDIDIGIHLLEVWKEGKGVETLAVNMYGTLFLPVKRVTRKHLEELLKLIEGGEKNG